ncbi:choice-of-anchor O protein [Marimonas arenosa]|uniref:Choice-of-anchor O protein n=1 Tax=Marimonas arenosa TaxID=1795305 RepID=A0AAE4B613_9RHOB|nr:choice-of-anchor O protein [Marimonas arenosa]MDQ2090859.1 choice-of-anchor O protein [Marimonas arenosa]
MRRKTLLLCTTAALLLGTSIPIYADDGDKVLKRLTGGNIDNQLTVLPEDVFGGHIAEAEHAYTDVLKFFVPTQRASGLQEPVEYYDIDENLVETLEQAKPLVNVFMYGPAVGVEHTAFAHSFMDAFAGVSLDDGETWKTTNLSQSADLTSFTLGGGGEGSGHDDDGGDDDDHHGSTLSVEIDEAVWRDHNKNFGKLKVEGEADRLEQVEIINFDTGEVLFKTLAKKDSEFSAKRNVSVDSAPCRVAAVADGETSAPITVDYGDDSTTQCIGLDIAEYPGGVYNIVHATAGNKAMVAWTSRFCQQGQPTYSMAWDGDDEGLKPELLERRDALSAYLGVDINADLYLTDLFGVAGQQRSINFADEGYPQAGEVPYGCLWTARGVLRAGDDPRTTEVEATHMVWTKPERLTSGRRDPNRVELRAVKDAGFAMTWQEDPDGLRPGQGLGPGEGWSGAVAHSKTDVWYSFLPWEHADLVENPDDPAGEPVAMADHDLLVTGRPQVYVPWAVPMRLTNNDKCQADEYGPGQTPSENKVFSYCNYDVAAAYGLQDFCQDTALVPQGQSGAEGLICVNEDGLPNLANTASTRARTSLQGYDSDGDGVTDSAWVVVATEESKGLGRFAFLPDGTACEAVRADDPAYDPDCSADIGKNQWYFSFDMGDPQTSATSAHENGLVQNLVNQGNLLNQPEVDWRTGEFYPVLNTVDMWDFGAYNYDLYNTEIARRSSLLVQGIGKGLGADTGVGDTGTLVMSSWKQGAMRQGGPADTMFRRILIDAEDYTEGLDDNPYAFTNMECEEVGGSGGWAEFDEPNPYYPDGVCLAPATNLSGVIPDTCLDSATNAADDCPTVDFASSTFGQLVFPQSLGGPILQGYIQGEGNTTKILTWHQCPSDGVQSVGDFTAVTCDTDDRTDEFANLKDQSWYNPLDVSKGHRGYLDGDFAMFLYAWSPNWRLNAKGNDRYDLYVRRSFDGGDTWTTTPASFTASDGELYVGDGTVTCENYRSEVTQVPQADEPTVCYEYGAGIAEQARNVTQHSRMRVTTLDPRYAPSAAAIDPDACVDDTDLTIDTSVMTCLDPSTGVAEVRDPSRYFMVFETGDNSTVQVGEAEPLDLFYSRAESFGDDYVVWAETDSASADATLCYPSDPHEDDGIIGTVVEGSGFCNEFDRANAGGDTHSSEGDLEAKTDGSKLYATWTQWVFGEDGEEIVESDAMARRIWWIDDYISSDNSWTLPGTNQPEQ